MRSRNTLQRQLVLDTLQTMPGHPTAGEVYAQVARAYPGIGLATVYRNLAALSEQGAVRRVQMPDGADRFDGRLHPHYHVQCDACHRLMDADIPYADALDRQAADATHCTIFAHDIVFHGNCPGCAQSAAAHSANHTTTGR